MQLFAQPWAIEPNALGVFMNRLQSVKIGETLSKLEVAYQLPIAISGDVATIPVSGILLKTVPGWMRYWGIAATGYDEVRQMVAMAVSDPRVTRIELVIDSPGGQVAGGMEAADSIRAADAVKPVSAIVEDLAASGAYWLATSARQIAAGPNAEVGSIGVFMVYHDTSRMYEAAGVKTIVIRSGEHKGMGVPGAPITETQIAADQEVIDQIAEHFIQQVATGRRMTTDQVKPLASGRVWLAPAALSLGLIDALTPHGQAAATNSTKQGDTIMPDQQITTAPADPTAGDALANERKRVGEINEAFGDDPKFALEAVANGWTRAEAKSIAFDRLKAAAAAVPKGSTGVPYNDSAPDADGDEDFMAKARELADERKISVTESIRHLAAKEPQLYARFLAAQSQRPLSVHSRSKAGGRVVA